MKNRFLVKTGDLIAHHKLRMLGVQLLFCVIAVYISLPVIIKGFFLVIEISDYSFVTKENFLHILKTPAAIAYIAILVILVMLLLLLNITMMVVLLDNRCKTARNGLWGYLVQVGKYYMRFIFSRRISRIFYMIPFGLAIYMPPFTLLLYHNPIMRHIMEILNKAVGPRIFWLSMAGIYCLSLCLLVGKFSYIRYLILGDMLPESAARKSKTEFVSYIKKLLTQFLCSILIAVICTVVYILFIIVSTFVIRLTADGNDILLHFFDIYTSINIAVAFFSAIICGVCNIAAITVMSKGYMTQRFVKELSLPTRKDTIRGLLFALVSCIAIYICVDIIFHADVSVRNPADKIQISAHRGASNEAPENTIPAIEKAIEGGADYVEIDVRLTADGEVVLMHDASTERTTDQALTVTECTYEELLTLDAGAWFSEEYAGTEIPSLEEVMEICENRIMMNIELKPADFSGELEQTVARMITEKHMEDQCIVTSFRQSSLLAVKEYNPDITTGYIYSFGYSNSINYEAMDILSIDARYLSSAVVTGAHEKGISVYAWTVNSKGEMRRMMAIGVDNIITDNILLAKHTIYEENENVLIDIWKYAISLYTGL